ncbi:MAG: citramalate synthase [Elusimicrobiota bacterium]
MKTSKISVFDVTLRDGAQALGVSLSVEDKIKILLALDKFGIDYVEGGWPGSNPKDSEFFVRARTVKLTHAKVVAFCSTRHKDNKPENDPNLIATVNAKTAVASIFGKSWALHVTHALKTTLENNLCMVRDSIGFLKSKGMDVIFDAEHFFDGFINNREYAVEVLKTAASAGAVNLTLCDTNGGMLPGQIQDIMRYVRMQVRCVPLGIHAHNDSGCGIANSVTAVMEGATLVQGTINGYGERCGNADLCAILPNLQIKLGYNCVSPEKIMNLTELSRYVSEIANMVPNDYQPYVGTAAFAHKGGIHASAVSRHTGTYEHIKPEDVGNTRKILISEYSGKSNVLQKMTDLKLSNGKDDDTAKKVLNTVKNLEKQGYQFEAAEESFELLLRKTLKQYVPLFDLEGMRVIIEKEEKGGWRSEATVKVKVNGQTEHTAADGDGPVNALDTALRKALAKFYKELADMSLSDFKVRVIDAKAGTAAKVRVLIESRDRKDTWTTIGVSENIIEASLIALVDAIEYKLLKKRGEFGNVRKK